MSDGAEYLKWECVGDTYSDRWYWACVRQGVAVEVSKIVWTWIDRNTGEEGCDPPQWTIETKNNGVCYSSNDSTKDEFDAAYAEAIGYIRQRICSLKFYYPRPEPAPAHQAASYVAPEWDPA